MHTSFSSHCICIIIAHLFNPACSPSTTQTVDLNIFCLFFSLSHSRTATKLHFCEGELVKQYSHTLHSLLPKTLLLLFPGSVLYKILLPSCLQMQFMKLKLFIYFFLFQFGTIHPENSQNNDKSISNAKFELSESVSSTLSLSVQRGQHLVIHP